MNFLAHLPQMTNDKKSSRIIAFRNKTHSYSNSSQHTERSKQNVLKYTANSLRMTAIDELNFCESTRFIKKESIRLEIYRKDSSLCCLLSSCNVPLPMTWTEDTEPLLYQNWTDRFSQFLRNYFSAAPSIKSMRVARHQILSDITALFALRFKCHEREQLSNGRNYIFSGEGRSIECVRMSLISIILNQLRGLQISEHWLYPPALTSILPIERKHTVLLQISVDSGCGTLKLICRFLRECGSLSVEDIKLIAEAQEMMNHSQI